MGEVFGPWPEMREETAALPIGFPANQIQTCGRGNLGQGAVPDIRDFSRIVCFAVSGGGEPFCLDCRDNPGRRR